MTPLMEPFDKEFVGTNVKEIEYDGKNMNAPQTLLDYLDHSLNQVAQLFITDFTEILLFEGEALEQITLAQKGSK